MKDKYDKILQICKKAGVSEGKLKDEYLFTIDAVDYFFYNQNIGVQDIRESFVDGTNDGGIDYIYADNDKMYLIQGKSANELSIDDIKNAYRKMDETSRKFENNQYDSYSKQLKSAYLNAYDLLSDDKNIVLVLMTDTILTDKYKKEFKEFTKDPSMRSYKLEIYDHNDIENRKLKSFHEPDFIKQDTLSLYNSNKQNENCLYYKNNGIIINIKASSLKRLYAKHNGKGLFSLNLREHITQKNVDSGIDNTIENDRENFWFYNNGITIGCEDFEVQGDELKLSGFSIINGAQTTTKIGKSTIIDADHDFAIVCKVVKSEKGLTDSTDFIMKISEASNSQKPIRPRDLKANSREQVELKVQAEKNKYPLAIEIKRGVKSNNYNTVEKWQRVTNEYIGQLILACLLQKPGTARSAKASIFTAEKIYNQIFLREHNYDILYDLVRIANVYEKFKEEYTKDMEDVNMIAICGNGKFTILSIIFYIYKRVNKLVDNCMSTELMKDNIRDTELTLSYKKPDYEEKLKSLFEFIVKKMSSIYEENRETLKLTSYSNFFKTDKMYQEVILKEIDNSLNNDTDRKKIEEYMNIFK